MTTAPPSRVSAVPRRMRIVLALVAVGVVVLGVIGGVYLRPPEGGVVVFRTSDQVAIAGLGLVLGAAVLFLGRSRVDADADGIRVLNIVIRRELPWTAVREVRFARNSAWAHLLLSNGDEMAVLALQIFDGERTVTAIEGLRALHAAAHEAARAAEPPRTPLLYDD